MTPFPETKATTALSQFTPLSSKEVLDLIEKYPIRSCFRDPIPAELLESSKTVLLPVLTNIINLSLETGVFPGQLKEAQLSPIIKKSTLDPEVLNNFHPISNLPYISKLVERAVAQQLTDYMSKNSLFEPRQSAYRSFHSTETALICVLDDLLVSLDNRDQVYVSLLDCSAAFDLVDHTVLLRRLRHRLGISGAALDWFSSYLTDRLQCVKISGQKSTSKPLSCGVPQGSVLGPILFTIYTLPVGDIIRSHNAGYHLYADDTQLFLSCNQPTCPDAWKESLSRLFPCFWASRSIA